MYFLLYPFAAAPTVGSRIHEPPPNVHVIYGTKRSVLSIFFSVKTGASSL